MTADEVIACLGLEALPHEGGFYRELYRSALTLPVSALPDGYATARPAGTSIYFLLTAQDFSALHVLRTDETWHFYAGSSVDLVHLYPDGTHAVLTLGTSFTTGELPQRTVPAGVWQGARLKPGGEWALLGCTMAPGFAWEDFQLGQRSALLERYPHASDWIMHLTRE